jgi:hypothetical protein
MNDNVLQTKPEVSSPAYTKKCDSYCAVQDLPLNFPDFKISV